MDCNIRTWNSLNGDSIHLIVGHTWSVNSLVILQNIGELISCSDDKTVKFWNLTTGNCLKTINDKYTRRVSGLLLLLTDIQKD